MNVTIEEKPQLMAAGTIRLVETVTLPPKAGTDTAREMGVVWIEDVETKNVYKYTDFSSQHKALIADQPGRVVFTENIEVKDNAPAVKHRNVVAVRND